MERTKSNIRKMWTGIKIAGHHVWGYLKSKEGRQALIQIVLIVIKGLVG